MAMDFDSTLSPAPRATRRCARSQTHTIPLSQKREANECVDQQAAQHKSEWVQLWDRGCLSFGFFARSLQWEKNKILKTNLSTCSWAAKVEVNCRSVNFTLCADVSVVKCCTFTFSVFLFGPTKYPWEGCKKTCNSSLVLIQEWTLPF